MSWLLVFDHMFQSLPFVTVCGVLWLYDTSMTSMALSSREKPLFQKQFLDDTFFYSVRTFARIRKHYFSKYWGDGCMDVPHLKFGGPSPTPPALAKSPPMIPSKKCQ